MSVRNLALAVLSATLIPPQPTIADDGSSQIADAAERLASSGKPVYISAEQLSALLNDADPGNDPVLISVCAPDDRAKAHVKDSITIPGDAFVKPANLAKLPLGRRIVVADYNGQAAVGTNYTLSILGYNARWLQYGTMGWSRGDKLIAPFKGLPVDRKDYPVVVAR